MHKRYGAIMITTVLLGVLGVTGYLVPASTEQMPNRYVFENAGGNVVFTHKAHAEEYGISCEQCHHESEKPSENPMPCVGCHPASFEEDFVADHKESLGKDSCKRCHHAELGGKKFDHEAHKGYSSGCLDCHHDPSIEPEPTSCKECHQAQGDETMLSLRDANHKRCASCHEDMFAGKLNGCAECHSLSKDGTVYPACGSCHFDSKKLPIPTRMEAYHKGCMKCHKERGAGPYTPEDCIKCHHR